MARTKLQDLMQKQEHAKKKKKNKKRKKRVVRVCALGRRAGYSYE